LNNVNPKISQIISQLLSLSPMVLVHRLLIAGIVILLAYVLHKIFKRLFSKLLNLPNLPKLVAEFLFKLFNLFYVIIVIFIILDIFGINSWKYILGISTITGLIFGFGMQDTISNFVAGIQILIYRPIEIGDIVRIDDIEGTVKELDIMFTKIVTFDNKEVYISNRRVISSPILNYSKLGKRRVDVVVGIAYGTDLDKAMKVALEAIKKSKYILKDPEPQILLKEFGDSSINLEIRAWCRPKDYVFLRSDIINLIDKEFKKNGIEIPFPQVDVHLKNKN